MKRKNPAKAAAILAAARHIVLTEGVAQLSTTKVAHQAAIAQSNVYIYFRDRKALIQALYQDTIAPIASQLMPVLADETVPLRAKITIYLRLLYQEAVTHPEALIVVNELKRLPDEPLSSMWDGPDNPVMRLLTTANEAGLLRPVPQSILFATIFGVLVRLSRLVQTGDYHHTDEQQQAIIQLLEAAIFVS